MNSVFKEDYRKEMDAVKLNERQKERLTALLTAQPVRRARRIGRMALAAAVACALLAATAAAYALGAFDYLTGRDEFLSLGQTELYRQVAREVGVSATADNGDRLSVERVAMDDTFGTIFYSVHFEEALPQLEWSDSWLLYPTLTLYTEDGEQLSEEGFRGSFEEQAYVADEHTVYGAWRFLLRRPVADGETLFLRSERYSDQPSEGRLYTQLWALELSFPAQITGEKSQRFDLDGSFEVWIHDGMREVEVLSLTRSPMGTLLKLRYARGTGTGLGPEFILRDADTGANIPYAPVHTSHWNDPEGYEEQLYELFGDVSKLKNLEIVPTERVTPDTPDRIVALEDLPAADSGNPDGGYAPASYRAEDGKLVVEMKPVGAVNSIYADLGNGVYFRDANGEQLFRDCVVKVEKFKDRTDGTITVVTIPKAADYEAYADQVAAIEFIVVGYRVLEGSGVRVPLQPCAD